ncbi:MAG: hypothetical protein JWO19_5150 [Bryobacterales bacterium]|nr:hypothetical protein [Bryobacterales bacterium]
MVAILITVVAQSACSSKDRLTFEAKVADLRKPSNSFAKNKAASDLVEITLPGKLLQPPVPVNLVRRGEADWSTPEHAVVSIFSANVAGDVSWIVENYVPDEREEVRKQFADPAAAQRVRDYYRNAGKPVITTSAEIRGFTVLFLLGLDDDGDATFLSAALSKGPWGWKQTNALARDDTFDLVSTALHTAGAH